jgi:hypothetical protein
MLLDSLLVKQKNIVYTTLLQYTVYFSVVQNIFCMVFIHHVSDEWDICHFSAGEKYN